MMITAAIAVPTIQMIMINIVGLNPSSFKGFNNIPETSLNASNPAVLLK